MNTIQLLNGETFSKKELLDKMMDDDFYYNFLGKNALSSSSIKLLLDSPKNISWLHNIQSKKKHQL